MQRCFKNKSGPRRHSIAALFHKPIHRVMLSAVICALLVSVQYGFLAASEGSSSYQYHQTSLEQRSTFLEYLLDTHIIVLWNYTVDDQGAIKTLPGQVLYTEERGQAMQNEIQVRVDILGDIDLDPVTLLISYNANTSTGYVTDYSIRVSYHSKSGQCTIENGTLAGRSGIFHLFLDSVTDGPLVISEFADLNASARLIDNDFTEPVLGESQECSQYACQFSHIVDGNVTHRRDYDKDTRVLVLAGGGVSDFILLGLGNISYAVGTLTLVGTSLDLGAPVSPPNADVPAVVGIGVFGSFGAMYVVLYRAQRSKKTHKKPQRKRGRRSFMHSKQVWALR